MEDPTLELAAVVGLGVGAQWIATRFQVPAILLLLGAGLAAGPGLGLIHPDELLGPLLLPVVSIGVGLLLFEGGLGLHFSELGAWRGVLIRLLTVGVVVSGVTAALAAVTLGGMPLDGAIVFGAMMTVTGPTVIIPILRQTRLRPRVSRVLRWEGIFVDAVGATLAIVALEAVLAEDGPAHAARLAGLTAVTGAAVGLVAATLLAVALGRGLVSDHAEIAVIVAAVVVAFAASNHLREESGLVAATVMGVALANQRRTRVRHVLEFHESLGTLLIGGIFILLGARVDADALRDSLLPGLAVLAVLVLVGRPLAVAASTIGSTVPRQERLFLAGMAPRGIVAASVAEVLALRLEEAGNPAGSDLAALTFVVVSGTVLVYGVAARPLSRRLRVAMPEPQGIAIVGGPAWAVDLARQLAAQDIAVLIVTTDPSESRMARHADLLVYDGTLADRELVESFEALGIRHVVSVSDREELQLFAIERLSSVVGRANVYALPSAASSLEPTDARMFGGGLDRERLLDAIKDGGRIETTTTTVGDDFVAFVSIEAGAVEILGPRSAGTGTTSIGLARRRD